MPLNFLHAQKRLTTLPALCWVEHEGCGHENLQQSQHHPDPAPVTSPHKNVVFLLLYLDVELRALTGLHVLKASCLGQGHAEALLQADWKVTHRAERPSCLHGQTCPSPPPSILGRISAYSSWAATTVHATSGCLSAYSPGVLWRAVYLPNASNQTKPPKLPMDGCYTFSKEVCNPSVSLFFHGLTVGYLVFPCIS